MGACLNPHAKFDARVREALIDHFGAADNCQVQNIKRDWNNVFRSEIENQQKVIIKAKQESPDKLETMKF